jgi:hypothetical protein
MKTLKPAPFIFVHQIWDFIGDREGREARGREPRMDANPHK